MSYRIRDDFKMHVTITTTDSDGKERNHHVIGTREQLVQAVGQMLDNQLQYGGSGSFTVTPIHPINVTEL